MRAWLNVHTAHAACAASHAAWQKAPNTIMAVLGLQTAVLCRTAVWIALPYCFALPYYLEYALWFFLMREHGLCAQLDGPAAQALAPAYTHAPLEGARVATGEGLLAALTPHVTSAATVQARLPWAVTLSRGE